MAGKGDYTGTLYYRKTAEGLVRLFGVATRTSGNVATGDYILREGTVPTEIIPTAQNVFICAGAGSFYCKVSVTSRGFLNVVGLITASPSITSNNVQLSCTWFTDK